jgi:hypothetical protein
MAESVKQCVQCGHLLQMYSAITINGAAYHKHCWKHCWDRGQPEGGHGAQPHGGPRLMPAVEHLQLGCPPR